MEILLSLDKVSLQGPWERLVIRHTVRLQDPLPRSWLLPAVQKSFDQNLRPRVYMSTSLVLEEWDFFPTCLEGQGAHGAGIPWQSRWHYLVPRLSPVLNQRVRVYCGPFGNEDCVICPHQGSIHRQSFLFRPLWTLGFSDVTQSKCLNTSETSQNPCQSVWGPWGLFQGGRLSLKRHICIFKFNGFSDKLNKNWVVPFFSVMCLL